MKFNDTSSGTGLIQECEDLTGLGSTGISGNTTRLKTFTRWINEAFSKFQIIAINSDGKMQWDDPNHTDRPIATADLVSGQEDYEIFDATPTGSQDWLQLERVDIKDSSGNWKRLKQIDKNDVNIAWDKFNDTDATPQWYDLEGASLILKPATDYNSTGGMKLFFSRTGSYFVYTDTDKVAGVPTIFQPYLAIYAAYKWGLSKGQNVSGLKQDYLMLEKDIATFFNKRNVDSPNVLRRKIKQYK